MFDEGMRLLVMKLHKLSMEKSMLYVLLSAQLAH